MTTVDYLDRVKARHGLTSDYALAKLLGLTRASVSLLRSGRNRPDDSTAIKIAHLLGVDPGLVVAQAHADRAKTPEERAVWESIISMMESKKGVDTRFFRIPLTPAKPAERQRIPPSP